MNDTVWRHALLTSSLDAVVLMNAAGEIVDFNGAAERLFLLSRPASIGARLGDLIVPPELRAAHREGLTRFVATGVSRIIGRRIEIDAMRTDGRRFRVELTIAVVDESRQLFVSHIRDIHGRVQGERRLKATAAVSRALAGATSAGEAIYGTMQALGEALGWLAVQYWRVDRADHALVLATSWFHADAHAAAATLRQHTRFQPNEGLPGITWAAGEAQWLENVAQQTGLPRLAALSSAGVATGLAFPVRIHGEVIAVIEGFSAEHWEKEPELLAVLQAMGAQLGHFLDELTARLEAERARRQAEEANRLKDEFLSVASHELRTPLNAVIGWAHLLREGRLTGEAAAKAIDAIARNAAVQARLVNDLLDMSRIMSGKFHLELAALDLLEVLHAAIDVVRPAADAKQITLAVHEVSGPAATLLGDAGRLQQVFWNVLSNAVKFTPRGGRVDVRTTVDHENVTVAVTDTGVGMEPGFLPRAFDRFAQADQTLGRTLGGLGLGLSIAQQFVTLHGGTIKVSSEGPGLGTQVTITLPLSAAPVAAPPAEPTGSRALAGTRVLLVDDEAPVRAEAAAVLEQAGAAVECAASAEEAIGCLAQSRFDVLVCDLDMPGRDGIWLVRELQSYPPARSAGVRRVALTPPSDQERRRALDAGYEDIVDKPLTTPRLLTVMRSIARQSRPS